MASWMVHLRITDNLLDKLCNLSPIEFVVGNIAPDSGIPNEDWSVFTPNGDISHFKTTDADGLKDIHLEQYVERYFTPEQRELYNREQKSFYLGYLTHLITDMLWADHIVRPSKDKFISLFKKDKNEWIWTLKKDWYDLDFLYLKKNSDCRAYSIYQNAVGFRNDYMDFFSPDAFDNRRVYITGFYNKGRDGLEREYIYLSEEAMDRFVEESTGSILRILEENYL